MAKPNSDIQIAREIAVLADKAGGRAFYVGGCVRDAMRGAEVKDLDIEVHGIRREELEAILDQVGTRIFVGESFGVYMLKGHNIDIAVPRKEQACGRGHRTFDVTLDPCIGEEEAARRRDFTINAMMQDVLTGEIRDYFGGVEDLRRGILRHVDDTAFGEDPLRALRAAQFAARMECTIAPETLALCGGMDLSTLSRERIMGELEKALLKAAQPSRFFEVLREMGQLEVWFPELKALIGVEQDLRFHGEGDAWVHTMMVTDQAAGFREKVRDPRGFMLATLCHDFGKAKCTKKKAGRIHAYGHEGEGVKLAELFLTRLTGEKELVRYVCNLVELHMRPGAMARDHSSIKATNHLFDKALDPEALLFLALADRQGMIPTGGEEEFRFLQERLEAYREYMERPYVTGRDLIEAGVPAGEKMGELLAYTHKLRLAGVPKEEAIRQAVGLAKGKK